MKRDNWTSKMEKKVEWVPLNYKVVREFAEDSNLKAGTVNKEFKDYMIKMVKERT